MAVSTERRARWGKKLQKYLDEAEKTEQQIAELEERLRIIRAAQKKEEDSEIIRAIRSTKMGGRELLALLDNIQAGNVTFLTAVNKASEEAETEEAIEKMLKRLGVVIPSTILTLLMAVGFSTPAFAYVDTTEVAEEPVQVIEEVEPTEEEKIPFTIAGNGEVEDDIVDDPSKEFFTVKTKGGNTFFLVIDRARNSENVYMLSMIDEYDLQEFLDDEERNGKQEEETPAVVLPETKPEPTPDVEIEEPKEESSGGMNKILLLVFVAALGGAGAFFYFYIYKPKPKEETPQSENLETDQSLATVNEDNQSGNENGT